MDLSIIIPVWNVEKYVAECLHSVMAQANVDDIKIECVVVDDCGQDNSMAVVEKTIAEYSGPIVFRIIRHEKNSGLSAARNTGIRNSSGKYITFVDSDDYLPDDSIYCLFRTLRKYPNSQIVQGEIQLSHPTRGWAEYLNVCAVCHPEYSCDPYICSVLLLNSIPMTAVARLIKREFIIENNLFFQEGMIHEDDMWTLHASRFISELSFCFTPVYFYRLNAGQTITATRDKTHSYSSLLKIISDAVKIYNSEPSSDLTVYILNKLFIRKKTEIWGQIKDKKRIKHQLNELNKEIQISNCPRIVKMCSLYNTLPAFLAHNRLLLVVYQILFWHYKNRILNSLSHDY